MTSVLSRSSREKLPLGSSFVHHSTFSRQIQQWKQSERFGENDSICYFSHQRKRYVKDKIDYRMTLLVDKKTNKKKKETKCAYTQTESSSSSSSFFHFSNRFVFKKHWREKRTKTNRRFVIVLLWAIGTLSVSEWATSTEKRRKEKNSAAIEWVDE